MNKDCFELIKEIKNTTPTTLNLCSNLDNLEKFVQVQELILKLVEFELEEPFNLVVKSFKDFFHPILLSTVSYETDFIKLVEPVLRYPALSIHTADVLEQRDRMSKAYSYHSVLNKLIEPTEIEKKVGELLFLQSSNSTGGLKQTTALRIIFRS